MTSQQVPLLQLRGLAKSFGEVRALTEVDLDVPAGQVTALVGDNGAGKSVLIKCIAGIHRPDAGRVYWHGNEVRIRSPHDASALGIETVYQDLALCDNLNVFQNLFLGRERTSFGMLDDAAMEEEAQRTLQRLAVGSIGSLDQRVGLLSGGQRQAVAIARSLLWHAELAILDEPTAALGVSQTEVVLTLARRLADEGMGVILISHNMNDVFRVADRVAVLYLGRMVAVLPIDRTDRHHVVELMTFGGPVSPSPDGERDGASHVNGSAPGRDLAALRVGV